MERREEDNVEKKRFGILALCQDAWRLENEIRLRMCLV